MSHATAKKTCANLWSQSCLDHATQRPTTTTTVMTMSMFMMSTRSRNSKLALLLQLLAPPSVTPAAINLLGAHTPSATLVTALSDDAKAWQRDLGSRGIGTLRDCKDATAKRNPRARRCILSSRSLATCHRGLEHVSSEPYQERRRGRRIPGIAMRRALLWRQWRARESIGIALLRAMEPCAILKNAAASGNCMPDAASCHHGSSRGPCST